MSDHGGRLDGGLCRLVVIEVCERSEAVVGCNGRLRVELLLLGVWEESREVVEPSHVEFRVESLIEHGISIETRAAEVWRVEELGTGRRQVGEGGRWGSRHDGFVTPNVRRRDSGRMRGVWRVKVGGVDEIQGGFTKVASLEIEGIENVHGGCFRMG